MHQRAGGAARPEAPAMEINVPHNLPELRLPVKDESLQAGSPRPGIFPSGLESVFGPTFPTCRRSLRRRSGFTPVDLTASLIAQLWNLPIFYFLIIFFSGGLVLTLCYDLLVQLHHSPFPDS